MNIDKIIEKDLEHLALEFLIAIDYKVDKNKSCFMQVLKLKNWIIEDKPRKVTFAKDFVVSTDYKNGLNLLAKKFKSGSGRIFRHQSRGLFNGKAKDLMFYDFGIHHLHLGIGTDTKHPKMELGTKSVVFVYINNDEAFFIRSALHGEWHLQNSLKIIHQERPDLIKHRIIIDVQGDNLTDDEILKCRNLGCNYCLNIDGTSYMPENTFNSSGQIKEIIYKDYIFEKILSLVNISLNNFVLENKLTAHCRLAITILDFDFIHFKQFKFLLEYESKKVEFNVEI